MLCALLLGENMALGLKKIKIPVKKEDLSINAIYPYLDTIILDFKQNSIKIDNDYNQYLGQHKILAKKRTYDSDSSINNIVCEPHLFNMINFKCGYLLGIPKEYALNSKEYDVEVATLHKILSDSNLRTVCDDVAQWVYSTGVGYYFIQPKSELPKNDYESPFEVFCQPANTCCKIYSSYIGEVPLFDCIFTDITKKSSNGVSSSYTIIDIYLPNEFYEFEVNNGVTPKKYNLVRQETRALYKFLPLVEQYSNNNRLGIVSIGNTLQYAIDKISSDQIDNIEEVVNQIYAFVNVAIGGTNAEKEANFRAMKKNGLVEVLPNNPQFPADIKTIATNLDHKNILELKETLIQVMYDCCGVPLASSSVTSGGDTQGARQLGNGWENAYTIILKDINSLLKADRELLKIMLWICKQSSYTGIKYINASDIEIKYNINRSNNLLVKTQSYVNLTQNDKAPVPPKIAMQICELTSDPETVGKAIEEYRAKFAIDENNLNE